MKLLLVFLGLAIGIEGQEVSTRCPDGWLQWQTFCYFFNNGTSVTWQESGDECRSRMAHQLRADTKDEYDFVKKAMLLFPSDGYWTALNDLAVNQQSPGQRTFMWGDDEFPLDSVVKNNWAKGFVNTPRADCVNVDMQGQCGVGDCSHRHAYICEVTKNNAGEFCPDGWQDSYTDPGLCYLISDATHWARLLPWMQARRTCEALRPFNDTRVARLLTISSQKVQNYLSTQLSGFYYGRQVFWTGFNDVSREGLFVWSGRNAPTDNGTFITWRSEPNNLGNQEHCGLLKPGGLWDDRNCDDSNNYACRLALPDNPSLFNLGCGAWTRAGVKCVSVYSKPLKTWSDARDFCRAQRGDLLRLDSTDDSMWLLTQSGNRLSQVGYWIGLNDRQTEGSYVWADGSTSEPLLLNWDTEPRSFDSRLGHWLGCASMGLHGLFLDMSCMHTKTGAVCEQASAVCGQGWVSHGGHCYLVDTTRRTHDEAADHCRTSSLDGTGALFALDSQDEKDWIVTQLQQTTNGTYFYWSNLVSQTHDTWRWLQTGDDDPAATQALVTWNSEPNDWRHSEDCTQVNVNGLLNDANCAHVTGFICQRPAVGVSGSDSPLPPASRSLLVALATLALLTL